MSDPAGRLAAMLAEAMMTGDALGTLPAELAPATVEDGEAIALDVLDALGIAACGVRVAPGPDGGLLAGPMLEGRLLPSGTTLPAGVLRHPRATAAVVGVLAEALAPEGDGAPVLASVHAAIDLGDSRFRAGAIDPAQWAADLGGLGHVVIGRRGALPATPVAVSLAAGARRPRGVATDLAAALAVAAAAARRLGGLPAGAVLVAAGLSAPLRPAAGETLVARGGLLGRSVLILG